MNIGKYYEFAREFYRNKNGGEEYTCDKCIIFVKNLILIDF
jgi:hypothetical protein